MHQPDRPDILPSCFGIRRRASLRFLVVVIGVVFAVPIARSQNSMVGDGFGGRLWYAPTNYCVGSYSAFSLCYGTPCDSATNQLYGWGNDANGELGNGPSDSCSDVPVPIPNMTDVRYYSTGYYMGAIKNDGTGWVWQKDYFPTPEQVLTDVKFVDASMYYVGFVKNDGTVWSIGNNGGQFGDGSVTNNFSTPVQMLGVENAVRVACGMVTQYVLLADGTVRSVGASQYGLLGDASISDTLTTTVGVVPGLSNIVDIKAHSYGTAALDANGDVYCWGAPYFTGNGSAYTDSLPHKLAGLHDIVAISGCTDGVHFLALDADRNCYMWGEPPWETLGFGGQSIMVLSPTLVGTDVIDIMAGETFSYFVKSDGSLWATGGSASCSIFLDLPNLDQNNERIIRTAFTRLQPSAVLNACPLVSTVAVPGAACDGSGGTITVTRMGGAEPYTYDIGAGPQSGSTFTGLVGGTYTVTVTDADGCQTTATCTVDPLDPPPVTQFLGTAQLTCPDGYLLPWGDLAQAPGNYTHLTTSTTGCDTLRMIGVLGSLPHVPLNDHFCPGNSYRLPSGRLVNATGLYTDTLVVANSCDTVFDVYLTHGVGPNYMFIVPDTVILPGESVELVIIPGATSYGWSPSTGLSGLDRLFPTASPTETTEYCVVLGNNGCPNDTACIKIRVEIECTAEDIFVPNAFSPNANGKNDRQCVYGGDCIQYLFFRIFDRWGTKVFETHDPKACWDGLHNSQPLNAGVYVYHLYVTLINGEVVEREGNITLVR